MIRLRRKNEGGDGLSNDHGGTKEKVIHVVAEDCIDDSDPVEIGKFRFCFTWSNPPFETKRVDNVLHSLREPMCVPADALTAFDGRSVWTIEDEKWEQWRLK